MTAGAAVLRRRAYVELPIREDAERFRSREHREMTTPVTTTARPGAVRRAGGARFPLGRRWRQATLIIHIVASGAWIGIDVIVGVLVLTGRFGADREVRALAYRSLAAFVVIWVHDWPPRRERGEDVFVRIEDLSGEPERVS